MTRRSIFASILGLFFAKKAVSADSHFVPPVTPVDWEGRTKYTLRFSIGTDRKPAGFHNWTRIGKNQIDKLRGLRGCRVFLILYNDWQSIIEPGELDNIVSHMRSDNEVRVIDLESGAALPMTPSEARDTFKKMCLAGKGSRRRQAILEGPPPISKSLHWQTGINNKTWHGK